MHDCHFLAILMRSVQNCHFLAILLALCAKLSFFGNPDAQI